MAEYEIRFAKEQDIPRIMRFIDEYWRKDHILATDRKLFEWQYRNQNKVNMVLGLDDTQGLQGVLGYIPYGCGENKDLALALWKAKEGTALLGIKLLLYLENNEPHRNLFCNGINMETTEAIYHRFGFQTGKLRQWYRLQDKKEYRIAKIIHKNIPAIQKREGRELIKTDSFQDLVQLGMGSLFLPYQVPYKSEEYIEKRYFHHPAYEYLIYAIVSANRKADAAVVFRMQEYGGSKVLRLIDFIGDYNLLYVSTDLFDMLALELQAEYLDIYEFGLGEEEMRKAGWLPVGEDANIIPNYFAPFSQRNVDIYMSTMEENIVLFKGDGDQDRPN